MQSRGIHVSAPLLLLLWITCHAVGQAVPATTRPDLPPDVQAKIDAARLEHVEASTKARQRLLGAIEALVERAANRGDLDGVKRLTGAKVSFVEQGTLPPDTKDAAVLSEFASYQAEIKRATVKLQAAYEEGVRSLTKARNFRDAEALRAEMAALAAAAPAAPPKPAGITVTGTGYVVQPFKSGQQAFSNRKYVWQEVTPDVAGWSFTRVDGLGNPKMTINVKSAGYIVLAVGRDFKLSPDDGWRPFGTGGIAYSDGKGSRVMLFARDVKAGESIPVPARPTDSFIPPLVLLPP